MGVPVYWHCARFMAHKPPLSKVLPLRLCKRGDLHRELCKRRSLRALLWKGGEGHAGTRAVLPGSISVHFRIRPLTYYF
jgi:hypothetical protein